MTISSSGMPIVVAGVAAEVLVREEEDLVAAFEGVVERLGGVAGGADDAVVLADEGLEAGGAVHVGDGDDAGDRRRGPR